MTPQKMQAVGFEEGIKNAEERIEYSLKYRKTPTVAIENILFKPNENWYDMSLFVLKDPDNQIRIELFGQSTPVPAEDIKKRIEKERAELNSLSIEEQLASYLKVRIYTVSYNMWHSFTFIQHSQYDKFLNLPSEMWVSKVPLRK